jgi:hypothetical protein
MEISELSKESKMPQTAEEVATKPTISDDEVVESFAIDNAKEGEAPFFRSKTFSRHLFACFYRINYYDLEKRQIGRSLFVRVDGNGDDRKVIILEG